WLAGVVSLTIVEPLPDATELSIRDDIPPCPTLCSITRFPPAAIVSLPLTVSLAPGLRVRVAPAAIVRSLISIMLSSFIISGKTPVQGFIFTFEVDVGILLPIQLFANFQLLLSTSVFHW